jgi:hypothetical protein
MKTIISDTSVRSGNELRHGPRGLESEALLTVPIPGREGDLVGR